MQNVTNQVKKIWSLVFNREAGGIGFFCQPLPLATLPLGLKLVFK